jgi:tetratricopeptide (TPR) repeat protein
MELIEDLIESASHDMFNPILNFNIGLKYHEMGQTASATSFYLRCAEYGYDKNPIYVYTSLLKIAECISDQDGRKHTVKNSLMQAIQYLPKRPEAYFLLARYYEWLNKWQECYMFSELGLLHSKNNEPLPADVQYPGEFALLFEKAVSGWGLGRKEESMSIFKYLITIDIPESYRMLVQHNIKQMDPNITF